MNPTSYNIRVYGLLISDQRVLITHENRGGMLMTKFPGGGHEMGEGLADTVIREFREELDISVEVESHFYVNEFKQISRFDSKDQLMSHYYLVSSLELDRIPESAQKEGLDVGGQIFEWILLSELNESYFTFPIDKVVAKLLRESF